MDTQRKANGSCKRQDNRDHSGPGTKVTFRFLGLSFNQGYYFLYAVSLHSDGHDHVNLLVWCIPLQNKVLKPKVVNALDLPLRRRRRRRSIL